MTDPGTPSDPQTWADRVHRHIGAAVESFAANTIAAGKELLAAKSALKHGEWLRMFRGHPKAVKNALPFSSKTAVRIMKIAKHPILSNGAHGHHLPPAWRTLYELTKVPEPVLRKAFADGRVHPGMERREVAALRQDSKPRKPADEPNQGEKGRRWDFVAAVDRIRDAVEREAAACPPEEWPRLATLLRTIAKELEARTQ